MKKSRTYTHEALCDENGDLIEYEVSQQYVVCSRCHGEGVHTRSDLDDSRLVDLMEEDGDYEGLEHYYRGGYDQVCSGCNGKRVQLEINWEEFWTNHPNEYKMICDWEDEERRDKAYADAERRACGGY
jgi:hypothetical protein